MVMWYRSMPGACREKCSGPWKATERGPDSHLGNGDEKSHDGPRSDGGSDGGSGTVLLGRMSQNMAASPCSACRETSAGTLAGGLGEGDRELWWKGTRRARLAELQKTERWVESSTEERRG